MRLTPLCPKRFQSGEILESDGGVAYIDVSWCGAAVENSWVTCSLEGTDNKNEPHGQTCEVQLACAAGPLLAVQCAIKAA